MKMTDKELISLYNITSKQFIASPEGSLQEKSYQLNLTSFIREIERRDLDFRDFQ